MSELNSETSLSSDLRKLWTELKSFFQKLVDLRDGLDREGTIQNIKSNHRMQGANAWLLMCSIMIASLGLDLDSPAIIIGAMLISPLMSPILGIGLGIGTNDRSTLWVAFRHFGVAIAIAVVTSTAYFFVTPLGSITDEILRRTEPTFLDVLVAFFGGVAGIISGSRKDKSNALPGVAIATALMPPLCVTGFGIATWLKISVGLSYDLDFNAYAFIVNSFYLFHLNAFFVAFATFIIVRHLRFPLREYATRQRRFRTMLFIGFVGLGMAIPSFNLLRKVFIKAKRERNKEQFIARYFGEKAKYIDESLLVNTSDGQKLILKVYGTKITQSDLASYQTGLEECGLEDTDLEIIPTSEIDFKTFESLEAKVQAMGTSLEDRIREATSANQNQKIKADRLSQVLDSINAEKIALQKIAAEIELFVDGISKINTSQDLQNSTGKSCSVNIFWEAQKSKAARESDRKKIEALISNIHNRNDIAIIDH